MLSAVQTNADIGTDYEDIGTGFTNNDLLLISLRGTVGTDTMERTIVLPFTAFSSERRVVLGLTGYNQAVLLQSSGGALRAKRGGGASAASSMVWKFISDARGAGDGLVLDGNDLDVSAGDGIEVDSDKVRVKLDGTSLARGANGLKVAGGGVGTTELEDGSVTAAKLEDGSVTAAKLAAGVGGNPRGAGDGLVLDGNDLDVSAGDGIEVDSDKVRVKLDGTSLARGANGLKVAGGGVGTTELEDGSVTAAKLEDGSVTAAKLAAGVGGNPRGAGDGLVLDGNDLDVSAGDGIEVDSDKVRVKLDGTSLARGANGLKVAAGLGVLADGAAIAWAAGTAPNASVVLGGDRTIGAPTGVEDGHYYAITLTQDATGGRAATWNAVYEFGGVGGAPTLAATPHARTKLLFTYEGAKMRCLGVVQGY